MMSPSNWIKKGSFVFVVHFVSAVFNMFWRTSKHLGHWPSLLFYHPPTHAEDYPRPGREPKPPQFTEPLEDCTADEGCDMVLRGVITGSQPISISWLHNGEWQVSQSASPGYTTVSSRSFTSSLIKHVSTGLNWILSQRWSWTPSINFGGVGGPTDTFWWGRGRGVHMVGLANPGHRGKKRITVSWKTGNETAFIPQILFTRCWWSIIRGNLIDSCKN